MFLVVLPFLGTIYAVYVSPISTEVIPLKKNDTLTCVAKEESLRSFVFLSSEDSLVRLDFKKNEYNYWNYNNNWYNKSVSSYDNFELNVDERWVLKKENKSKSHAFKPFENGVDGTYNVGYACLINLSSLTVIHIDIETNIMKKSLDFQQYSCGSVSKDYSTHKVNSFSLDVKTLLNNTPKLNINPKYISIKNNSYILKAKYTFFYSNKTDLKGSYFKLNSSDDCVSMYVSVNIQCYLKITLETKNHTVLNSTVINGTNPIVGIKKWQRVDIQSDYRGKKTLYFRRGRYDNKLEGYWAVDYIKKCENKSREKYICERFNSTPKNLHKSSSNKNSIATIIYISAIVVAAAVVLLTFVFCLCKFNRCKFKQQRDVPVKLTTLTEKDKFLTFYNNDNEIHIDQLEKYLLTSLGKDVEINVITEQYEKIPFKKDTPCDIAGQHENENKNRYPTILPYDDTRVILHGNHTGDYINANFIDGYNAPQKYIATQYPLPTTVHDFWYMIWQKKIEIIVMLTELDEKYCEKYWPQYHTKHRIGNFLLENIFKEVTPNYTCRKIQINYDDGVRFVQHLHYTLWPNQGIPFSIQNFTDFIKEIRLRQGRTVVHCNAGCGRTGTYILCDIALSMAINTKKVNFGCILEKLRAQRVGLVSNVNQYIFAHFVILEYLFGEKFAIPIKENFGQKLQEALKEIPVSNLMERLEKDQFQYEKTQIKTNNQLTDEDKLKNRLSTILPGQSQVFLPITTHSTSTYINAVSVNCYRYPNKFIVTQQPLENTIMDFWIMCKDQEVDTILSLNEIIDDDPLCRIFWPTGDEKWSIGSMDTLEFVRKDDSSQIYDIIHVKICNEDYQNIVQIFQMKNWERTALQPKYIKNFIEMWKKTLTKGKIIVTCYDGATASGLFVAMAYLFENLNMDHVCDVYSAIKTVRESRHQFIQHPEQIEFLYRAAYEYVQEFNIYENFRPIST